MGMGYTPYRQTLEWELRMAGMDATKLWEIRGQDLMRQFGNATLGKDKDEVAKVREGIRNFNFDPCRRRRRESKAITADALYQSVEKRATDRALQERGLSSKTSDIPILRRRRGSCTQSPKRVGRGRSSRVSHLSGGEGEAPLQASRLDGDQALFDRDSEGRFEVPFGHIVPKHVE